MKKNTGFTLIELLVVIAIIGVLSSVVMSSVGKSREKGQDGAAKADLASVRSQAALYYDENNSSYGTAGTACDMAASVFEPGVTNGINTMVTAAETVVGSTATCANSSSAYVVAVPLKNGDTWCIDSVGYAGTTTPDGITGRVACQ